MWGIQAPWPQWAGHKWESQSRQERLCKVLTSVLTSRVRVQSVNQQGLWTQAWREQETHSSNKLTKRLFSGKCWFSIKGNSKINDTSKHLKYPAGLSDHSGKACFQMTHKYDLLSFSQTTYGWYWVLLLFHFRDRKSHRQRLNKLFKVTQWVNWGDGVWPCKNVHGTEGRGEQSQQREQKVGRKEEGPVTSRRIQTGSCRIV